jgi:hypothetical protein
MAMNSNSSLARRTRRRSGPAKRAEGEHRKGRPCNLSFLKREKPDVFSLVEGEWNHQVCADLSSGETLARAVRALVEAQAEHPEAMPLLLSLDASAPASLPPGIRRQSAAAWLLGNDPE